MNTFPSGNRIIALFSPSVANPENFMLTVIGGIIIFCGLLMLVYGIYLWRRSVKSNRWPTAQGTVMYSNLSWTILFPFIFIRNWKASITYTFYVNGKQYRSYGVANGGALFFEREDAQKLVDEYPVGKEVTVYYDPKQPRYALLLPGTTRYGWVSHITFIALGVLVALIGIWILLS